MSRMKLVSRLVVTAVLMFALSIAWGQSTNSTKPTKTARPIQAEATKATTPAEATKTATPTKATKTAPPTKNGTATTTKARKTDDQIRQELIRQSIADYSGSCPCPYNIDRAGRQCGGRSAYSRPGGASPLCYARDVTKKMVDEYRVLDEYRNRTKQ